MPSERCGILPAQCLDGDAPIAWPGRTCRLGRSRQPWESLRVVGRPILDLPDMIQHMPGHAPGGVAG